MQKTNYETKKDFKQILGTTYQADDRGIVLADFFEISDKAKEGGMGNVYFCRDKRDNKFYVLKTASNISVNTDIFQKECELVLRLWKHPYVTYSKTVVWDKNQYYIVMEFVGKHPYNLQEPVQGETLARVMNKIQLEPKQALIWALQFCQGMHFLNTQGMQTHKDIKPDNILVTPENNIKITDFGLASIDNKGGTVGYRSPEYFKKGAKLTIQSDIYSFGLVLYQMLNGGRWLPSATVWSQDKKEYEHINIDSLQSAHCLAIIRKCLSEDPSARYQDFQELETDILGYIKDRFPEYVPPKLKTDPMNANDYFLKGLGYYFLRENLRAFLLFSLAIFEDPKMAEARYYRSKIQLLPLYLRIIFGSILIGIPFIIGIGFFDIDSFIAFKIWSVLISFLCLLCIPWLIGFLWLLFVCSRELGWKTWRGLLFLIINVFQIIFSRSKSQ